MKIAIISTQYYNENITFYIENLRKIFQLYNIESVIIGFASTTNKIGITTSSISKLVPGFLIRKKLKNFLIKKNIDIIHYIDLELNIKVLKNLIVLNIPVIVSMLEMPPCFPSHIYKKKKIKIITISEVLRERLVNNLKVDKSIIKYIGIPIDWKSIKPMEYDLLEYFPVIAVDELSITKNGVECFIKAIQIIVQTYKKKCTYLFRGETGKIIKYLKKFNFLKDFIFVSSQIKLEQILNSINIFIVPFFKECYAINILKSLAAGVPVITSNTGGVYSLVKDNYTGFLIPPNDENALAEKILYFLKNPEIIKEMNNYSREFIKENFSIEKIGPQLVECYKEIEK